MNKTGEIVSCDALHLIHSLLQGGKATEARLDVALSAVGLSVAKWSALRHLAESDGELTLGQLAERLACVRSNVTQLVDRLEAERLVRRAQDPDDRRSVRAELTLAGQQRYEAGRVVMQTFEQALLEDYTPDERRLLERLLSRLTGDGAL